jgi:cytochrome P450
MALHPEVQKKAQAEIDAVVGLNRLPDFEDRPFLPYINAVVKESMRWHLVAPLGEPLSPTLCLLCPPDRLQTLSYTPHDY